jgi:hypothetical protein
MQPIDSQCDIAIRILVRLLSAKVLGSEFLSEKTTHNQPLEETWSDWVDTIASSMNGAGDKMVTNAGTRPARRSKSGRSGRRKKAAPFQKVKAGSAVVPIYRTESDGRVRFTVSFYREGRRVRKVFNDPEKARKEALFIAQRIHSGMWSARARSSSFFGAVRNF